MKRVWWFNRATHRDLGYFASSLLIAYCVSGVALNHIDTWNPDFQIEKRTLSLPTVGWPNELGGPEIRSLSALVGETAHRFYDVPAASQVKIYYKDATFHARLDEGIGTYERISRRPLFYQVNVLHRNSFKPWKWAADLFAIVLILINLTGLFILKGKNGLSVRGKWLVAAGALPPAVALLLYG